MSRLAQDINDEWRRRSELIRQQNEEYQEALAKDMENMEIKPKPEPDTSPKHIKQLLLKAKFNHIQNGFIIPLTHCLQPHFVNEHGSIQEDLRYMDSDDERDVEEHKRRRLSKLLEDAGIDDGDHYDDDDKYTEVQYTPASDLNLDHTILRPHGIKHLIEINKQPEETEEGVESSEDSDDGWENYNRYSSDNEKESSSKPTPNPFGDSSTDEDEDDYNEIHHPATEKNKIYWTKSALGMKDTQWEQLDDEDKEEYISMELWKSANMAKYQKEQNKLNELARLKEEGIIPVQLKIPEDLAGVINKDSITVYATCESNCRALKIISPYPVPGISRVGGKTWTEVAENNTEDNLKHFFSEIERLNRHFTKKPSTTNTFSFEHDFSDYRLAKPCWKRLLEIYNDFNDFCTGRILLDSRPIRPLELRQRFKNICTDNVDYLKQGYLALMKSFFTSMYNAMNEEVEIFKKSLNEDDLELFESHENGDKYQLEKLFEVKDRFVFQIPKMKKYIEKGDYNFTKRTTTDERERKMVIRDNVPLADLHPVRNEVRNTSRTLRKIYFDTKKKFEDWIINMLIPEVDRTLVVVNDLYKIFQKKGYFVNMFSKAYCEKINQNNWSGIRIDGNRIELEYLPGYEEMTREISLQCMKKNTRDIFVRWRNYEKLLTEQKFDVTEVHKQKRAWDRLGSGTDSIFKYRDTVIDISDRAKRFLDKEDNFAYKTIQIQTWNTTNFDAEEIDNKDWINRWFLNKYISVWITMYHHYIEELDEIQIADEISREKNWKTDILPEVAKKWNDIKASMLLFYDRLYNRPMLNMMYIDNHRVTDPFEEHAHIQEYPIEQWDNYIGKARDHHQRDIFNEKGWNYVRGTEYNKMQMFFNMSKEYRQEKGFEDFRFTNDPDLPLNFCDMIYACNLLTIELAKNPLKIVKLDSKKTAEQLPFGDMFVPKENKKLYSLHKAREQRAKSNKGNLKSMKDLKFSKTTLRF